MLVTGTGATFHYKEAKAPEKKMRYEKTERYPCRVDSRFRYAAMHGIGSLRNIGKLIITPLQMRRQTPSISWCG